MTTRFVLNARRSLLMVALMAALVGTTPAASLLPAASGDRIPPTPAASRTLAVSADLDRNPVSYSWRIDSTAALQDVTPTHRAESREFWINTDATALRQGLSLNLTAAGAVVRISPVLSDRSSAIDPATLEILQGGARLDHAQALRSVIPAADLAEGSAPFPEGSSAFRLADSVRAGKLTLRAPQASGGRYVVHVFDVQSSVSLSLQADRDTYFPGESLAATAMLRGATAGSTSGLLSAPDGSTQTVQFSKAPDGSHGIASALTLPALGAAKGLYELHVWTAAGTDRSILRDARTAFALAAPTARLDGTVKSIAVRGSMLAWSFGLQTGQPGRYALEATLYLDGKPYATAQSAAWLAAGAQQLQLSFENGLFQGKPVGDFELRHLRLLDQGQLVTLEHRALALRGEAK